MHPVLIEIGGVAIHSYGAAGALGFLVVAFFGLRETRERGWDHDKVVDIIFYSSLAGIVGARGLFVIQNAEVAGGPMDWVNMRTGGMVFYGAIITGIPVLIYTVRRAGVPLLEGLDAFGKAFPIGHAIARIGCFAAGCCYGAPSDLPWSVVFSDPTSAAPIGVHLHPVQLYEAAGLFLLGAALFALDKRKRFHGQVILTYVGGYAMLRFLMETMRGDADRGFFMEPVLGSLLTMSQGIALVLGLAALAAWVKLSKRPMNA